MELKELELNMWMLIMINLLRSALLMTLPCLAIADLIPLGDDTLKKIDGEGIGVVLEDFVFQAGEQVNGGTFEISGLENTSGQEVVFGISQFYVSGSNSNRGTNVIDNPVNLGRLLYPYNIELRDGNKLGITDKAVLELAAPEKIVDASYFQTTSENRSERRYPGEQVASGSRVDSISGFDNTILSSRESEMADLGIRFDLEVNGGSAQSLENHIKDFAIDGSYIRLWGGTRVEAELNLNIYATQLEFRACNSLGNNCGDAVSFNNIGIEFQLGDGSFQPVTFEVTPDGQFSFLVGSLAGKCATNATGGCVAGADKERLTEYYNTGPTTNAYIGNVRIGDAPINTIGNFGSSTISNLQIQYLEVKSHDL
tara:strand:+ start:1234 stop:2340 length:1107 start_codon:yes stop_codon:yes gene_type:complete